MALAWRAVRIVCAALVVLLAAAPAALATSMDKTSSMKDYCAAGIGADAVQMWAYLVNAPRHQYCEEIPAAGRIILTFDLLADRLRELPIEARIIRAPLTPLDEETDLEPLTVASVAPQAYPRGALMVEHDFKESGLYIALVTATEPTGERKTARFNFTVGPTLYSYLPIVLGAALIAGLVVVYWRHGATRARK